LTTYVKKDISLSFGGEMKIILIFLIAISIFAKEENKKAETLLGEIVVQNTIIEEDAEKSNKTNQKNIEKKGSINLKEAIEQAPSIHFNIGSRGEADFNMRGFTSREIPLLINGVPVYMPYNGVMDFFKINTEIIQEINIKSGISSVLYGPNSMGGAINIVTKSPKQGLHLNIWSEAGLKNNYYGGATLSYSDHGFYALFAPQYWHRDGYIMPNSGKDVIENGALVKDNDTRENSQKNGYSTLLKVGYKNKKSAYELSWFHLDEETGMPIELNNDRARYWKFPVWSKDNITLLTENKVSKVLSIKNRVFYDNYYNKLESYKTSNFENLKFDSIYDDYSYGFISNPKFEFLEINNLEFSAFYKHDVHREGESPNSLSEYDKYAMDTFSVASEYRLELDLASITAGISYDINTTVTDDDKLKNLSTFNPQIKSTFWIANNYSVELSVGKKTRFPTLKELFSGYIDKNIPNPELTEESTIHYQAFFNTNFDLFNTKLEIYYSDVKDMITDVAVSDTMQQLQNVGKAHFIGTELSLNTSKIYNYVSISASYSYQYSYSEILKDNKVPFQPENIFKTGLTVYFPIDSFLYIDVSFIGEQYELDFRDNWVKISGYSVINLKYEQKVYKEFALYAKINNLLNSEIYTQNNFPLAGREFYLGLKYKF
jgi:iron complex outermembrane receptor protein